MIEEWHQMASVSVKLPVTQFLSKKNIATQTENTYPPKKTDRKHKMLVRIHPNTRQHKYMANWPVVFLLQQAAGPVWVMSLRKVTSLSSNLASVLVAVTGLKRIQPSHGLCCVLEGNRFEPNISNVLVRSQTSSLSQSLSPCLSSGKLCGNLSKGCSRRESKV